VKDHQSSPEILRSLRGSPRIQECVKHHQNPEQEHDGTSEVNRLSSAGTFGEPKVATRKFGRESKDKIQHAERSEKDYERDVFHVGNVRLSSSALFEIS